MPGAAANRGAGDGPSVIAQTEANIQKGNEAFHKLDFQAARDAYLEAFQVCLATDVSVAGKIDQQVRCGNNLTVVLFKLKQYDQAQSVCESVLEVAPPGDGQIGALMNLGKVCCALEDTSTATTAFEQILQLGTDPQRVKAQKELDRLQLAHSQPVVPLPAAEPPSHGIATRPRSRTIEGRSSVNDTTAMAAEEANALVAAAQAKKKHKKKGKQQSAEREEEERLARSFGGNVPATGAGASSADEEPRGAKKKHRKKKAKELNSTTGDQCVLDVPPPSDQNLLVPEGYTHLSSELPEAETPGMKQHYSTKLPPKTLSKCPNRFFILGVYLVTLLVLYIMLPYRASYQSPTDFAVVQLDYTPEYTICAQQASCYKCTFLDIEATHNGLSLKADASLCANPSRPCVYLPTRWPLKLVGVKKHTQDSHHCDSAHGLPDVGEFTFWEHGNYSVTSAPNSGVVQMQILPPEATREGTAISLLVAASVLLGLWLIYVVASRLQRLVCPAAAAAAQAVKEDPGMFAQVSAGEEPSEDLLAETRSTVKKSPRLQCLDTFRGISLAIMIFANKGGGGYWYFDHSAWNGLTVADLVFPWFCWIMGTSMALSLHQQKRNMVPRRVQVFAALKRNATLFALGLFLNHGSHDNFDQLRIPGVLQYLAVAGFFTSLIVILVPRWGQASDDLALLEKRAPEVEEALANTGYSPPPLSCQKKMMRDIKPYLLQWLVVICIGMLQIGLTFFLPVPGCPTGYLGPGGLADYGEHRDCTGGASTYIDHQVFGLDHTYHSPTCQDVFQCKAHDPEGLLGSLNAIVLCWLGHHAGRVLLAYKTDSKVDSVRIVVRWLLWSVLCGLVAGGLCGFSQNDGVLPVNKNLWSSSFILALASGAFAVLALLFLVIDRWRLWSGAPFSYLGMNSIVIYVGSELIDKFPFGFPYYADGFEPGKTAGHEQLLADSAVAVASWLMLAYFLYANDSFFKI